jgi:predicted dehydrogenase
MKTERIGIIMNGVTGRMGTNQHLIRSIKAIMDQGGVRISDSETLMPDPVLVGRSADKLRALAARVGIERCSTDLDAELGNPDNHIYFDAALTALRPEVCARASPPASTSIARSPSPHSSEAVELARLAEEAGVKNGVVLDKLWLPACSS